MAVAYVVTSIQRPTEGVQAIAHYCSSFGSLFIVVGDRKTPEPWVCSGATYLGVGAREAENFVLSRVIRENSYTRKMLGYLCAVRDGASWIRETDDDNAPYPDFFADVPADVAGRAPVGAYPFVNIYPFFTERFIWPRGLPLHRVREGADSIDASADGLMVLQAVADGDPDVDAVYRLTAPDTSDVMFDHAPPLIIPAGTWTPFNSQATTWPIELLPLMYLPSTCSFRMTDIWRSYIAQRLMPGLGATLVITGPTVYQDRNEHDLMRDFRDEVEGYVGYERFVDVLESTPVVGGFDAVLADLRTLYAALIDAGFFTSDEMPILDAWIADMETFGFGPPA